MLRYSFCKYASLEHITTYKAHSNARLHYSGLSANAQTISKLLHRPDLVDWHCFSESIYDVDLLQAHVDKIIWSEVSANPAAIGMLHAHLDKIHWATVSTNPGAIFLLQQHPHKICMNTVWANPNINCLLKCLDLKNKTTCCDECVCPHWMNVIKANANVVNWNALSMNPSAIPLLADNLDKINWKILSVNPNAISLLEANLDKVDWDKWRMNPAIFTIWNNNATCPSVEMK